MRYRREKPASCGFHLDASPKVTGGRRRLTRKPSKLSSKTPKATRELYALTTPWRRLLNFFRASAPNTRVEAPQPYPQSLPAPSPRLLLLPPMTVVYVCVKSISRKMINKPNSVGSSTKICHQLQLALETHRRALKHAYRLSEPNRSSFLECNSPTPVSWQLTRPSNCPTPTPISTRYGTHKRYSSLLSLSQQGSFLRR